MVGGRVIAPEVRTTSVRLLIYGGAYTVIEPAEPALGILGNLITYSCGDWF